MGVVYKAFDPDLDRAIALKLVAFDGPGTDAEPLRQRLLREAKTLAQLSHPNVVAVHDVGTFEGSLFVAMEFVAGQNLRSWLGAEPRSTREILSVFAAAGAGLAAAHELGIVHRDFKPENVMFGEDGRVRVLDFGLACSPGGRVAARPSLAGIAANDDGAQLTREGALLGTPAYMAPEQDAGEEVDARSDQFSFCVSLYEALFGQRPFRGTTYLELAARRAVGEIEPAAAMRGVRTRVRAAVLRGLRAAPSERHRDMPALLAELRKRPWHMRARVWISGLGLAALVAAGWALWTTQHAPPTVEETCAAEEHELDDMWNAEQKVALERRLMATGNPRAPQIASHVERAIDDWLKQWSQERVAACQATLHGDRNAAARLDCLQAQRRKVGGDLLILPVELEPGHVQDIEAQLPPLPKPRSCDVDDAVTRADPEVRAGFESLQKIELAGRRGDYAQAIEYGRAEAKRNRGAFGEPLALIALGRWQMAAGHYVEAADTLRDALIAAARDKNDAFVLGAWIYRLQLTIAGSGLDWHAEQAIFGAELAFEREPDDSQRADLPALIAEIRIRQGDLDEAERQLQAAQAALGAVHGLGAAARATSLESIDAARAEVAMLRGQFAEAHRLSEQSLQNLQRSAQNRTSISTQNRLAWLLDFELRHDEARAMYERALHIAEAMPGQNEVLLAQLRVSLAGHDVFTGVCDGVGRELAHAEPLYAMAFGRDSAGFATIPEGQGACALWAHDDARALKLLEAAHKLIGDHPTSLLQLVATELFLSHAYRRRGNVPQANELAASVRVRLAKVPGARAFFEELDHRLSAGHHSSPTHRGTQAARAGWRAR
jgi:tetratricopeptide (TPR) repeat protein